MVYTAQDGSIEKSLLFEYKTPGVAMGMYNTDESIRSFAHSSFQVGRFLLLWTEIFIFISWHSFVFKYCNCYFVYTGGFAEAMALIFVYQEHDSQTLWRSLQGYFRRNLSKVSHNIWLNFVLHTSYNCLLFLFSKVAVCSQGV